MSDSDQEIAFRFAVDRVNSDRTVLPDTRLTAQIERVPQHDSFYAAKQGNRSSITLRGVPTAIDFSNEKFCWKINFFLMCVRLYYYKSLKREPD